MHPGGADPALIERMARRLAHRGPDGYGTHHDGRLAFGAGRLAIIDLSAPAGPIFSEDRRVGVVFNGEIYNYKALRADLERAGHFFATHTDTEVIVHGYEQWGVGVIERLRGMFALCLWDSAEDRLLLARDRMGEKPLYYARPSEGEFLFASEAKALFEHPGLQARVNPGLLPHLLILGYAPPPHTMFAGVEKLAPGEQMIVQRGMIHKALYWQPHLEAADPPPYDDAVKQVRRALRPLIDCVLTPAYVASVGIFRPETITRALESHRSGGYELWPLWTALVFHVWHALYIDRSLTLDGALTPDLLLGGMVVPPVR